MILADSFQHLLPRLVIGRMGTSLKKRRLGEYEVYMGGYV